MHLFRRALRKWFWKSCLIAADFPACIQVSLISPDSLTFPFLCQRVDHAASSPKTFFLSLLECVHPSMLEKRNACGLSWVSSLGHMFHTYHKILQRERRWVSRVTAWISGHLNSVLAMSDIWVVLRPLWKWLPRWMVLKTLFGKSLTHTWLDHLCCDCMFDKKIFVVGLLHTKKRASLIKTK